MEYTDLRIQIADVKPGEDDWVFRVTAEDAVTRSKEIAEFTLPESLRHDLRVLTAHAALRATRGLREEEDGSPDTGIELTAKEIGNELFEALFASNIQKLLDRRRSALESRQDDTPIGLRLRFELNLDHEGQHLTAVPWELLCRDKEFFGLSLETPIVRSLDLGTATNPLPAQRPLEILYIRSNPPGTDHLAGLDPEEASLAAWDNLTQVNVTRVENATLSDVRDHLMDLKPHVLHYMGHGDFKGGVGMLAFEDGEVSAEEFCRQLKDFQPRLVVLNACNTGESEDSGGGDPFAGMASSLIELGVAAVVAMQKEVDDRAANAFAQRFYETLVGGLPIDAAVAEGRLAIHNHEGLRGSPEWATPVLFMQTRYDGVLLEGEIVLHRRWKLKQSELSVWLTRDARGNVNLNWHSPDRIADSDVVALYADEPDPDNPLRYLMDTATFAARVNDRGEYKHRTARVAEDREYWAAYLRKTNGGAYEIAATSPEWSWDMPR